MNPAETARLAASEAVAGLCPITEANLGDGVFPARAFLASGGRFGIGSDSNVRIDAAEELRLLEYGQRLTHRARGLAGSGATLFRGAREGGAQALGAPSRGLAAGEAADIVSLDGAHPGLAARSGDALLDAFVFGAGTSAIDGVWRDGVKVVSAGVHHHRDEIATAYRKTLARLLAA
jgi:cytosine/adenosine deaminase-related metal-dependent hydrolase